MLLQVFAEVALAAAIEAMGFVGPGCEVSNVMQIYVVVVLTRKPLVSSGTE